MKEKKKKSDEVSAWKARILRSKDFQKTHSKTWDRNEKLVFGIYDDPRKQSAVAYGWGLVQALATSIYIQNPDAIMEPYDKSRSFEQGAMWSSIMQYDLDMMDLKSIGNLGLIDNFVCGYFAALECVDTQMSLRNADKNNYLVADSQMYSTRRIPPKDLLLDWQGTRIDLSDSRFLAAAWYPTVGDLNKKRDDFPDLPSVEDLMKLPTAYPTDRKEYNKGGQQKTDTQSQQREEQDPDFKTVCVWEVHDRINKKIYYVLDDTFQEIGSIDWPATFTYGQRDMFPVTLMAFHPVTSGIYPKPEVDLIAPQLMILNLLDAIIYEDALTKWRKYITFSGLISQDKAAKIVDVGPANAIVEVDKDILAEIASQLSATGEMPDIQKLVMPLIDPSPKQDLIAVRDLVRQEINDIIGYGPPERGGMPSTRSAREAVAIKENLDKRLAKRADAVAEFYRLFGAKHFLLLQQTMEVKRYARVFQFATGAEFKEYMREDIQGSFNYRVYAGTSGPQTTEQKRASELQLFQTLMPLIQAGMIPPEPALLRLAENFQWVGVGQLLKNYIPEVQRLAMLLEAIKTQPGQVPPNALPEQAAKVVMSVLSPQQIQAIETGMQGRTASGKAQEARPSPTPSQNRGDPDALGTESGTM